MASTLTKETVAESQKFVRYLKEFILDIANSSPENKHKLNQLMDSHINKLEPAQEGMRTRDFRASSLGKTIASMCKLIEAMDFVDEKNAITAESIKEGLEINVDKDIYILLYNDIEFRTLWAQGHSKTRKALTTYIKILYFYGHPIVDRCKGYESFGELITGYKVVERDPFEDVNKAREYVNNIIDTVGPETDSTKSAKGTANNLIDDIVKILGKHGINSTEGNSFEDILLTANIDDIIEDTKKVLSDKLETGEVSMNPLKDIYSAFMTKLSSEDGNDMSQILRGAIAKNNM